MTTTKTSEARLPIVDGEEVEKVQRQFEEADAQAEANADEVRLGKLSVMRELFDAQAFRARGAKRHKRAINKAVDAILDEEEPSLVPMKKLCREAVAARTAGLFDLLDE